MKRNLENVIKIVDFIKAVETLKFELRLGKENADVEKRDSVAAHSWRMSLLTYLLAEELSIGLDVTRCIKMSLVHDLPEALVGDTAYSVVLRGEKAKSEKQKEETEAMQKLTDMLPAKLSIELFDLWQEYEQAQSNEAKFVKAMDKIEAAYQYMSTGVEKLKSKDATALHINKVYGYFPETDELIRLIKNEMKTEFEAKGLLWKPEYNC